MHVYRTTGAIVAGWMCLGVVVGEVVFAGPPSDGVVAEPDAISDPVVAHVDGFRALEADGVGRNALGGGIVGDKGCSALWVPEVRKG